MSQAEAPTRSCIFIRLPSRTEFLAIERALVRTICQLCGFPDEDADRIVLAVDEACTNIIRHGYGGPCERPIEISAAPLDGAPGGVVLRIRDYGVQVDPDQLKPCPHEEIRPGGQGVNIIYKVMDEVRYSRADGGGMELLLIKRRNDSDAQRPEPTDTSPENTG